MSVAARKRRLLDSTAARNALPPARRGLPVVRHLTLPYHEIARTELVAGETIHALVRRTSWAQRVAGKWSFRLPTICVVNGRPVLQAAWRRLRLVAGDIVEFWSRPMGGARGGVGKNILGLVAIIALAAFAPWAGAALFGAGTVGAAIFTGAITLIGGLLVSALTTPKPGGQAPAPLPLYSVAASGNTARLLQPITVQYGRVKSFPDFAIIPWSDYQGNDQYLHVLLSVGVGTYSYEKLYIDTSALWTAGGGISSTFHNVEVAFYAPNAPVTLFPTNVVQSVDVSGQVLTTSFIGGFIANPPATLASFLAVDLVFPSGCFSINSTTGAISNASAHVHIEYRPVNDAGAPTGSGAWSVLSDATYTYATRNPIRLSVKVAVAPARYEVKVERIDAALATTAGSNTVAWAGLRGYIHGPQSFPVSTVAIRIKANEQLTQASAVKFGVLCTRILPVWNGSTWTNTATRSPAWAFYDAAVDTIYGAKRPASKVDFQGVFDLAASATARGDTFDYRFTGAGVPAPTAFDTILKSTRARHRWSGDVLTIVRDEWADTPRMLLTDREIARGSLSLDYSMNTADSADAVVVEYLDEGTWGPGEVQYPPNSLSFTALAPARIQVDGVVNRAQAHREAAFYYLQSQLRRVQVTLDTEHDGRMLGFGSRVRVTTELPQSWGYSGVVTNNAAGTLTLSPAPTWDAGTHYIAIRDKTGRQFGPVLCTQGGDASQAVLDATDQAAVEAAQGQTLAAALTRGDGAEDPSFDFGIGTGTTQSRSCLVVSGRPSGDKVTLTLIVDNQAVHSTDLSDVEVAPTVPALRDLGAPVIAALVANFRQGIAEPILDVSWAPANGATSYVGAVSYDSGTSWLQVYDGPGAGFSVVVDYAALQVRVQGIGKQQGAWFLTSVGAPTIVVAPGTVDISSMTAQAQHALALVLNDIPGSITEIKKDTDTLIQNLAGSVVQEVNDRIADTASARNTLNARIDGTNAAVVTETSARVAGDSALSSRVDGVVALNAVATAAIASEQTARVAADSALSTSVGAVSASVATKVSTFYQDAEPSHVGRAVGDLWIKLSGAQARWDGASFVAITSASGIKVYRQTTTPPVGSFGDEWFKTDDFNRLFVSDGTAWQDTRDGLTVKNTADIGNETTARVAANSAQASQIANVSAQFNGISANGFIRMVATAGASVPAGVVAQYEVQLQTASPGVFAKTGLYMQLLGDGTSRLFLDASQIFMGALSDPAHPNMIPPFALIAGILQLQNAKIVNCSIDQLSSLSANIGNVIAGKISSKSGSVVFDLDNDQLLFFG